MDNTILLESDLIFEEKILDKLLSNIAVDRNNLLDGFPLEKVSIEIDFSTVSSEMYKVDLDTTKKDSMPTYLKIDVILRTTADSTNI